MADKVTTFRGSYGEIDCDPASGKVLAYRRDFDGLEEGETGYSDITLVDLEERVSFYGGMGTELSAPHPDGDITDVGFWCEKGNYYPADRSFQMLQPNARLPLGMPM